jgi:hypothetical protein
MHSLPERSDEIIYKSDAMKNQTFLYSPPSLLPQPTSKYNKNSN